jgi:hypothetical protein
MERCRALTFRSLAHPLVAGFALIVLQLVLLLLLVMAASRSPRSALHVSLKISPAISAEGNSANRIQGRRRRATTGGFAGGIPLVAQSLRRPRQTHRQAPQSREKPSQCTMGSAARPFLDDSTPPRAVPGFIDSDKTVERGFIFFCSAGA